MFQSGSWLGNISKIKKTILIFCIKKNGSMIIKPFSWSSLWRTNLDHNFTKKKKKKEELGKKKKKKLQLGKDDTGQRKITSEQSNWNS